jgi:hypothetical protein
MEIPLWNLEIPETLNLCIGLVNINQKIMKQIIFWITTVSHCCQNKKKINSYAIMPTCGTPLAFQVPQNVIYVMLCIQTEL